MCAEVLFREAVGKPSIISLCWWRLTGHFLQVFFSLFFDHIFFCSPSEWMRSLSGTIWMKKKSFSAVFFFVFLVLLKSLKEPQLV